MEYYAGIDVPLKESSVCVVDSCRFTFQCGTPVLLDFNYLGETGVSLEAFQLGLPEVF
jgi:hypothetical protein